MQHPDAGATPRRDPDPTAGAADTASLGSRPVGHPRTHPGDPHSWARRTRTRKTPHPAPRPAPWDSAPSQPAHTCSDPHDHVARAHAVSFLGSGPRPFSCLSPRSTIRAGVAGIPLRVGAPQWTSARGGASSGGSRDVVWGSPGSGQAMSAAGSPRALLVPRGESRTLGGQGDDGRGSPNPVPSALYAVYDLAEPAASGGSGSEKTRQVT